jgi:hypothetical protein
VAEGNAPRSPGDRDEPPPFGGSWLALYAGVLALLVAIVVALQLLTRAYS